MKKRNVLQSPKLLELKRRRRRALLHRTIYLVAGASLLLLVLTYLSRLEGMNIKTIEVEGESIVSESEIQAAARREISGKYLWLFPKANVLLYPKGAIVAALHEEYKRLEDIELSLKADGILHIGVSEREPKYLWCESLEADPCYFMDSLGYVFDRAPHFSGDVYFKFIGLSGVESSHPEGSRFAPDNFENMVRFEEEVRTLGLEPTAYNLKEDGDAELLLKRRGALSPKILLEANGDSERLAANLAAALDTEPLKTRMKKEYNRLEYLDLRFENKVYSKFAP